MKFRFSISFNTVAIFAFCITGFFVGYFYLVKPVLKIRQHNANFDLVTLGMNESSVYEIFGEPNARGETIEDNLYWHDELRSGENLPATAIAVRYQVDTFYLPIIYEIALDSDGKVIGKHRHD